MNTRMPVEQMLPLDVWADLQQKAVADIFDDERALVRWLLSPEGTSCGGRSACSRSVQSRIHRPGAVRPARPAR